MIQKSYLMILIINFNLNDFVKYSSSEYEINDNIDWSKNGNYQITFIIGDLKILTPPKSFKKKSYRLKSLLET